jgi:hypothetical protein
MKFATRVWATLAIAIVWIVASITVAAGPAATLAIMPKVSGAAAIACLWP